MKQTNLISRNFEMILGFIGSIIGIYSGICLIFLEKSFELHHPIFGIIVIITSILGLFSTYYVRKNAEIAGIGFIIATMFVIVGARHINILSALFLLIAGVSALFRK